MNHSCWCIFKCLANKCSLLCTWLSATIISGERLKRYVSHKLSTELPEGPYCILYMHSTVNSEDNNPGMSILRWVYEELPSDYKERLEVVYFLHPGLRSRLAVATLGRLFLSGRLVYFEFIHIIYWSKRFIPNCLPGMHPNLTCILVLLII